MGNTDLFKGFLVDHIPLSEIERNSILAGMTEHGVRTMCTGKSLSESDQPGPYS